MRRISFIVGKAKFLRKILSFLCNETLVSIPDTFMDGKFHNVSFNFSKDLKQQDLYIDQFLIKKTFPKEPQ